MKNYYEMLGVNRYSTPREIKKAYNKSVRKYPSETKPQEYMEIREAYDTLFDEESRDEYNLIYDEVFKKQIKIENLKKDALEHIKKKEYSEAETSLKKILLLDSKSLDAKKLLSDVLFHQGFYSKSLIELNELMEISPEPISDYYFCRGLVYLKLNNENAAKEDFIQAYYLNSKNYRAVTYLIKINLDNNNLKEAIEFLTAVTKEDLKWSVSNFICLLNLIICYIAKDDTGNINTVIRNIEKITPDNNDIKNYMCYKLVKLAVCAATEGYGISAIKVIELIKEINPGYNNLDALESRIGLYKKVEELVNDDSFEYLPIKEPIVYLIYGHRISKSYYEKSLELIKNDLNTVNKNMLIAIKNSISRLKSNYEELFKLQEKVYSAFDAVLENQLKISAEYEELLNDSAFTVTFRKCIKGIETNHTKDYNKSFNNLKRILDTTIRKNIENLRKYPILNKRYDSFISTLETMLNNNEWPTVRINNEKKENMMGDEYVKYSSEYYDEEGYHIEEYYHTTKVCKNFGEIFDAMSEKAREIFIKDIVPGLIGGKSKIDGLCRKITNVLDKFLNLLNDHF